MCMRNESEHMTYHRNLEVELRAKNTQLVTVVL